MIDKGYLDSRAEIDYDSHDELQMSIIINKIKIELKRRYGERVDLVKDPVLRKLLGNQE